MSEVAAITEITLRIESEYRHHHADVVLGRYPEIEEQVRRLVSGVHGVVLSTRRTQQQVREGLTATSLNKSLKSAFMGEGGWGFEATVSDGVIFDSATTATTREGFDLAQYDVLSNGARFWSLCFGRRPVIEGPSVWAREIGRRPAWAEAATGMAPLPQPGVDLTIDRTSPTIFGDIQFGNWALAYRDLMRLLDADVQLDVDLYVYVTGTDSLNAYLSDGIVTFNSFRGLLSQFSNLVKTPIWVVGLGRPAG